MNGGRHDDKNSKNAMDVASNRRTRSGSDGFTMTLASTGLFLFCVQVVRRYASRGLIAFGIALTSSATVSSQQPTNFDLARWAQSRAVKIYGAGGVRGLEAYQSGFLVSPFGHVVTAWSYVLDVEPIVVLDDGRRFESEIVGFEPALELAVLKIDLEDGVFFELPKTDSDSVVQIGDPILAVSNLFGVATGNEPASVMQGTIASLAQLDARRGTFKTPYSGNIYVLDLVANNPGAAGGALVNTDGQLVGMLGKELRDGETGVWLNYAVPAQALRRVVADIIAGRKTSVPDAQSPVLDRKDSHNPSTLGLVLVPDVIEKTPVYVDEVKKQSAAAMASVRPDDLILMIDGQRVDGQASFREMLRRIDRRDPVQMTIQRGTQILPLNLNP